MRIVSVFLGACVLVTAMEGPPPGAQRPPRPARAGGSVAGVSKKITELEKLAVKSRSLEVTVQQLQVQLNRVKAEVKALRTGARTGPDLLKRLDRMEARLKAVGERVSAVAARQADMARRQAAKAAEPLSAGPGTGGWQVGYARGFVVRSPSNRFLLRISGFVWTEYALAAVYPERDDVRSLDPSNSIDRHGLALLGARLRFTGHIASPKIGYALSFEGAYRPHLRVASLSFRPWRFMEVTVGQIKVPDSWQYLKLSGWMLFSRRSAATVGFASGHDIGAFLTFRQWKDRVFQQVGVFNGAGANRFNDNLDLLYLVRFGVQPFGPMPRTEDDVEKKRTVRMHVGLSGSYNLVPAGDTDGDGVSDNNKSVFKVGVEAAVAYRGLSAQAEFFYRVEDHGKAVGPDHCPQLYIDGHRSCKRIQKHWGIYAQAGYYVWKGLQLAVRYSYADVYDRAYGAFGSMPSGSAAASLSAIGGLGTYWTRSWYSPLSVSAPAMGPRHVHEATGAVFYDLGRHFKVDGHRLRVGLEYSGFWELGWRVDDVFTSEDRQVHAARVLLRLLF